MRKTNKVVRISYSGGIIGLVFGSARGKLEKVLKDNNAQGWNLAEVVSDNPNLIIWIFRLVLLSLTLGLWTLSNSYLLILERPIDGGDRSSGNDRNAQGQRREPALRKSPYLDP